MSSYIFIGDDFTGASDTLATLAEGGRKVRLFLDAPGPGTLENGGLDALGVATDLRALPPAAMKARLEALAPALLSLKPALLHYKICSTFDSAPETGNVAVAIQTLEAALSPALTVVLGGQPSLGRYCIFGNLFARAPDGITYRIDRHPIMSRHPVTPMTEADIRLHFGAQGLDGLELLPRRPAEQITADLTERMREPGRRRVLLDAVDQTDIAAIGAVLTALATPERPILAIGASSVAEAMLAVNPRPRPASDFAPVSGGATLVVAGSRSSETARQVAATSRFETIVIAPEHLAPSSAGEFAARVAAGLEAGRNMLIHLDPEADYARSPATLSADLAALTTEILRRRPVRNIAIAGGDTSSAVVKTLAIRSLAFERRAGAGVAICRVDAPGKPVDGARLLLKGGQVGARDIFDAFAKG